MSLTSTRRSLALPFNLWIPLGTSRYQQETGGETDLVQPTTYTLHVIKRETLWSLCL
jgi:hypothetical protein